jgi:hypothetical protein
LYASDPKFEKHWAATRYLFDITEPHLVYWLSHRINVEVLGVIPIAGDEVVDHACANEKSFQCLWRARALI